MQYPHEEFLRLKVAKFLGVIRDEKNDPRRI